MKKSRITTDDLAAMIKTGFDDVHRKMDGEFKQVKKDIGDLKQGQEDIKLRLDNVAYRFELVALEKRVRALEKRGGIPVHKTE